MGIAMQSAENRFERLWASNTAHLEFAGEDAVETRPCFMGAMRDFLTENKAGIAIKKALFAGMAAITLSGAIAAPAPSSMSLDHAGPGVYLDSDGLFSDKGKFDTLFRAIGQDFNLELLSVDINDQSSLEGFAEGLTSKGIKTGYDVANALASNNNSASPVGMNFLSGVDEHGELHHVAAISYNSDYNHVLGEVFQGLEDHFGANVNEAIENATWLHESMHSLIKSSEQRGMESWKEALNGDFSAYEKWESSVSAQLAHPEIRAILAEEMGMLKDVLNAPPEQDVSYDAGAAVKKIRAVQQSNDYTIYHENMADGFMSVKFLQDGHEIADLIGDTRAQRAGVDPLHDSSVGQRAISSGLGQSDLVGLNAGELASITAKTVQAAMGYSADFDLVNNGIDDELVEVVKKGKAGYPASVERDNGVMPVSVNSGSRVVDGDDGLAVLHGGMTVQKKEAGSNELVVQNDRNRVLKDALNLVGQVKPANEVNGLYRGSAIAVGHSHWVQNIGRDMGILHASSCFDGLPDQGSKVDVSYKNGIGRWEALGLDQGKDASKCR